MQFKNGLIYANLTITHEGKKIEIDDVIIDTGASHTVVLPDFLYEHEIGFDEDDELVVMSGIGGAEASAVKKRIESISIGDIFLKDVVIDFGVVDPKDRVNGLVGLDFLKTAKIVIDLDEMTLYKK